jgi:hypothetical protein
MYIYVSIVLCIFFVLFPHFFIVFLCDHVFLTLNKATIKIYYPLPQIKDLVDHLQGDFFFTKIDLTVGYH